MARFLFWIALLGLANYLSNSVFRIQGMVALQLTYALLLAILLLTPRRQWPAYLITAFPMLIMVRALAIGSLSELTSFFALVSTVTSILAATAGAAILSRDRDWVEGRSDQLGAWATAGFVTVVVLPLVCASIFAAVRIPPPGYSSAEYWFNVYSNVALAYLVLTPPVLRARPRQWRELHRSGKMVEAIALIAGFGVFAALIFKQPSVLPLFLILPPLIIILFRVGFIGLSVAMALLVPIAVLLTGTGQGPFHAMDNLHVVGGGQSDANVHHALLFCRVFLVITFIIVVMIAALLHEREQLQRLAQADRDIYEMVARQSGDMAFVCDLDGRIVFISPVTAQVLGLGEGALGDFDWRNHIHPDDLGIIDAALQRARRGEEDVDCLFRAFDADGNELWFENRMRLSTTTSKEGPRFIVGSTREVTARVLREQQLEKMAAVDVLTGLPNRRQLNEQSRVKWRMAARHSDFLSLHVIDIDFFKAYNDVYGHAKGDKCLGEVASAIRKVLKRPDDFCARYGGEEFVALLPGTDAAGALKVGEDICAAVRNLNIQHDASEYGIVSVSVGCATIRPAFADDDGSLFEAADAALYQAKRQGRNRVVASNLRNLMIEAALVAMPKRHV
ncbi:diguanylate cyclase [Mesorhizobium sp. 1M-11]|uniref:sensor domain-containing diguanylate cyclase n=1 Tax=Mesorhizobium sp. 1M-11 TaxID=1529006 RepID=UPI0006C75BD5|nr:diguanylate cyclase [Mesorhizobium sp. 1M-11]